MNTDNHFNIENKIIKNNQNGQSLVEYALLLFSVMVISLLFMRSINSGVANYWVALANLILDDKSQILRLP